MPLKISKQVKARLTKRHWVRFWGQRRMCKPMFVDEILGNGEMLISVTPLNTRPHYYLIRIDSHWLSKDPDDETIYDHLDDIYEVIEDQFGRHYEDKYESPTGRERYNPWPAL